AEHPDVPDYRQALAHSHNNLGLLLADLGKLTEAGAAHRAALRELERLAAEHPAVPEYRSALGASYSNFGRVLEGSGRPVEPLPWHGKAIATLSQTLSQLHRDVTAQEFLRNGHYNRARALGRLKRYAESAMDYDRAAELDVGPSRREFRYYRVDSLARAGLH